MPGIPLTERVAAAARALRGSTAPGPAVVPAAATYEATPSQRAVEPARTSGPRRSYFLIGFTATLGGLTAYAVGQAVIGLSQVLTLLLVALFLAMGLNPAVEWLERHGWKRGFAILAVFLAVVTLFTALVIAVVPPLVDQATGLVDNAPDLIDQLKQNQTVQNLDDRFDILSKVQDAVSGSSLTSAFGGILGVGAAVLGAVFSGFTILVLTLYFLGSFQKIKETGYRLVPASRRARVRELGDRIIASVGGFVIGQSAVAATAGTSTFIFLTILTRVADAPILGQYALALALVIAVLDLVPLIGALVGAAIVTLVALVDSPSVAIVCAIFFLIYQQIENYVVSPRVMRRSVDIAPIVTIIAALVGGALLGVVGALVAIPTGAAVVLIVREVVFPRQDTH